MCPESLTVIHDLEPVKPKRRRMTPPGRDEWVRDIGKDRSLFFLEHTLRFIRNMSDRFEWAIADADTFIPVAYMMTRKKADAIFYECASPALRKRLKKESELDLFDSSLEEPKTLLLRLWRDSGSNPRFRRCLSEWTDQALMVLKEWRKSQTDAVEPRFVELQRLFKLSDPEVTALVLETVLANGVWPTDDFRKQNPFRKVERLSVLLGMTEPEYLRIIDAKSKLRRLGCMDDSGEFNICLLSFLTGMDDTPLANRLYRKGETEPLPWSYFGALSLKEGAFLKRLIASRPADKGLHVLLYGRPGTGKTSFAVTLAKELGLTPFFISQPEEDGLGGGAATGGTRRFAGLQVCAEHVDPRTSLIIVDEADSLLMNDSEGDLEWGIAPASSTACRKGALNDIMDAVKMPCVWITNSPSRLLDSSNRRRFDYSIRFDELTHEQCRNIWANATVRQGLQGVVTESLADELARKYRVSAGGIDLALRHLAAMLKNGQAVPQEAEQVLESVLSPHCKLLHIQTSVPPEVRPDYSLEGLNIRGDISPARIEAAVRRFQEEQGGDRHADPDRPRMTLLLSGPPGTGKTEFVKYLGMSTRSRVLTRMGGDLLNKYVGGTEQCIRQAFREASNEKALLFLDEVDGILQSRERANQSWEVTQVNELLHQMENFDGILFCATNFLSNLDAATLRRFTFKIAFDYLDDHGKLHFFRRFFKASGIGELGGEERLRLLRIPNLAPGDFRTVRQSFYYLGGEVTAGQLLGGLEQESAAKRGGPFTTPAIGFK